MRLALKLGMSLRRCQREVTSREFTRWVEFFQLEPFGPREEAYPIAELSAMFQAAWFKCDRAPSAKDFLRGEAVPVTVPQRMTPQQIERALARYS